MKSVTRVEEVTIAPRPGHLWEDIFDLAVPDRSDWLLPTNADEAAFLRTINWALRDPDTDPAVRRSLALSIEAHGPWVAEYVKAFAKAARTKPMMVKRLLRDSDGRITGMVEREEMVDPDDLTA